MFFRFGSALILVVMTSLLGILVEKQNLALRREISRQHYRMDVLQEEHARLRLKSQQLAAVERLFETIEDESSGLVPAELGSTVPLPFESEPSESSRGEGQSNATSVGEPDSSHTDTDRALPAETNSPHDPSDLTTRRVPLLFWRKPASDPRLTRGLP